MAYDKIITIHNRLDRCVDYVLNEEKTDLPAALGYIAEEGKTGALVTGINCTPERAWREMRETKRRWDKTGGVQGYADWVFYNASGGTYVIGHGGGARMQHTYCTDISWDEAQPGDLVFYPEDEHVGIVCGRDGNGNLLVIHCASGANNVVITGISGFTSVARPVFYGE